jgi:chromosome segregation ATPase
MSEYGSPELYALSKGLNLENQSVRYVYDKFVSEIQKALAKIEVARAGIEEEYLNLDLMKNIQEAFMQNIEILKSRDYPIPFEALMDSKRQINEIKAKIRKKLEDIDQLKQFLKDNETLIKVLNSKFHDFIQSNQKCEVVNLDEYKQK